MTKCNIGDLPIFPIAPNVTVARAGIDTCTPSASKFCCWQGTTSDNCDSANGGYSGCVRTNCDWRAGNISCNSLAYAGKTWRLPTSDELEILGKQLSNISVGKNADGLMLCDTQSGYSSARCYFAERCPGSYNEYCNSDNIWSGSISETRAYNADLDSGVWYLKLREMEYALSVRCVSDL